MQPPTLEFEPDNQKAGYRLQRMELLNWGTFDNSIYRIIPGGGISLLTGANGSGKSTIVDALLTLLVPNLQRNYNQASGAGRKRERNEQTYIRGAFGNMRSPEGYTSRPRYLREGDTYSVLLARFSNKGFQQNLTLAQVLWIQGGSVRKFFVVARTLLSIDEHFRGFATIRKLKKQLRDKRHVELFDQFNRYSRRFRSIVGLRSEKALSLFNQLVAVKEVGNLNAFVRRHMLESIDVQSDIEALRENFLNLNHCYEAIQQARRQRDQLMPLVDSGRHYRKMEAEAEQLDRILQALPACIAVRRIDMLEQREHRLHGELEEASGQRDKLSSREDELQEQKVAVEVAKSKSDAGQRLEQIKRELKVLRERIRQKRGKAARYRRAAQAAGFEDEVDSAVFNRRREEAIQKINVGTKKLQEIEKETVEREIEHREIENELSKLKQEEQILQDRKTRIPPEYLEVRSRLCEALDLNEDDLPFAGELVRVRRKERAWEGALERLLRPFACTLLVSPGCYSRINGYVENSNLEGRIRYYRADGKLSPHNPGTDARRAYGKLDVRADTVFQQWIQHELLERFPHICCQSLREFEREPFTLMRTGLIRSNGHLHEKDDSRSLENPRFHVLGWDNRETLNAVQEELRAQTTRKDTLSRKIEVLNRQKKEYENQREALRGLLYFESFEAIDWEADAEREQNLLKEQKQLQESSDILRELEERLNRIHSELNRVKARLDEVKKRLFRLERDLDECQAQRERDEELLRKTGQEELDQYFPVIKDELDGGRLTIKQLAEEENRLHAVYQKHLDRKRNRLFRQMANVEKKMTAYKKDYPEETTEVDDSIDALPQYEQFLEKIERDDLPRHEKQFKRLLNEKVVQDVVLFKNSLEAELRTIEERIDYLNRSLKAIDYSPSTYVQLMHERSRDREILDFREQLRACLPDVGQTSSSAFYETSFLRIKELIDRFDEEDQRWTRKVTDVRNWLDFAASERYRENDEEHRHYSDSSGASGGQKAKLAYTIMASAVAYQYGLDYGEARSNSFRFVVIDEAFSKSDDANARYAMELFQKMDLQLMVVTPLRSIHIVEPFLQVCHFVYNNEEGSDSKVVDLSRSQFFELKEEIQDQRLPL